MNTTTLALCIGVSLFVAGTIAVLACTCRRRGQVIEDLIALNTGLMLDALSWEHRCRKLEERMKARTLSLN